MTSKRRKNIERWSPLLLLLAIVVVWEVITSGFGVSEFIFPSPSRIWAQTLEHSTVILGHAWRTFWVTMAGFGIAIVVGVLLGFLIGSSRLAYAAVYPLMTAFNALPKAAFVPILVVWFGIGAGPAILTAFLISFFPIMVNIATGLATLEPELEDVLRVLGAKRWDVLMKGHHRVGDDRRQRRHRLPADLGWQLHADGPGLQRPAGGGADGDGDVRAVQLCGETHHGLGA